MSRAPERVLALRLGGIGEVLAITPTLRGVRRAYPKARITLLAERPAGEIARGLVDEIVSADAAFRARGGRALFDPRVLADAARLAGRILGRPFDLFLDFHHRFAWRHGLKPLIVAALARASRRVGFGPGPLLTDPVPDPDDRPMYERNRAFLEALGLPADDVEPRLEVDPADQEWVDALLAALDLPAGRFVAVAPGSSRPETRWGEERFRRAAERLARRGPVVFVGGPDERALCAAAAPPGAVNLAGRTTVGRLAALLRRAAILVANDSGPVHMAYALKTPVVGLYRPGEVHRWGAYPDRRRFRALAREGPGADRGATLPWISVEDVVAAAEELLDANPPRA
jgi:ADP-heptose:LPS heptosyltransferase